MWVFLIYYWKKKGAGRMATILIVDDNIKIRRLIDIYLRREGFDTLQAGDGTEVFDVLEKSKVDLIVADIMMPNVDGYALLQTLRDEKNDIPVLMATAKTTFADKKHGFELGADDYMTKPIDLEELVLRIRALLRRAKVFNESKLAVGNLTLDYENLEVRGAGQSATLPQKEFQLLFKLLSNAGRTFTRQELLDDIWGYNTETTLRTVDVHISRLRERFGAAEDFEIVTVHSLGYKCVVAKS
jgi:DNA-binding response OmpR family regulator